MNERKQPPSPYGDPRRMAASQKVRREIAPELRKIADRTGRAAAGGPPGQPEGSEESW